MKDGTPLENQNLVCYEQMPLDEQLTFLENHNTQEGTWAQLTLSEGECDVIFLNGQEKELSRRRINNKTPQLLIPPAARYQVIPVSKQMKGTLAFYCKPNRYFSKKYELSAVHSDLQYIYLNYLCHYGPLTTLDVGCGFGRNLLFLAAQGYPITGIDNNEPAIEQIDKIAQQENLTHVQTAVHDLNQPLKLAKEQYHFIFSTVTIQLLQPERISSLLQELQHATTKQGFHMMVLPVHSDLYPSPDSFIYLPKKEELYHFYQNSGWSILEYKESVGLLHKKDELGRPLRGLFCLLFAQKNLEG